LITRLQIMMAKGSGRQQQINPTTIIP